MSDNNANFIKGILNEMFSSYDDQEMYDFIITFLEYDNDTKVWSKRPDIFTLVNDWVKETLDGMIIHTPLLEHLCLDIALSEELDKFLSNEMLEIARSINMEEVKLSTDE